MRLINADTIKYTSYVNGDITVSKENIDNMPTVEAIPINRLAEIMANETEHAPCDFISESCFLNHKCPKDFKTCWKEFFKHYAEVEE